jgi:hypothetical protein
MTAIKYRYGDVDGLKVFYREAGHAMHRRCWSFENIRDEEFSRSSFNDEESPRWRRSRVHSASRILD